MYYSNPGYDMFSRYLNIVIILDIVIIGDKQRDKSWAET